MLPLVYVATLNNTTATLYVARTTHIHTSLIPRHLMAPSISVIPIPVPTVPLLPTLVSFVQQVEPPKHLWLKVRATAKERMATTLLLSCGPWQPSQSMDISNVGPRTVFQVLGLTHLLSQDLSPACSWFGWPIPPPRRALL